MDIREGDLAEDLSDEQIQQLLQDAEQRLRSPVMQQISKDSSTSSEITLESLGSSVPGFRLAKLNPGNVPEIYIVEKDGIAKVDPGRLVNDFQRKASETLYKVHEPVFGDIKSKKDKNPTAGANWFDLPRTNLTSELQKDLQILRMRSVLDPKRHYKKDGRKGRPPEFFQIGTVIEGPTEFYSARIPNKSRKRTFVDETLAYEEESGKFKAKYEEIQASKSSGKKAYYKSVKDMRKKVRR